MLQGLEVLSSQVVPITEPNGWIFLIGIVLGIVFGIVLGTWTDSDSLAMITMLSIMLLGLILSLCNQKQIGIYVQYKVTISEDVNFIEFNEKYEIISQEGKILINNDKKV